MFLDGFIYFRPIEKYIRNNNYISYSILRYIMYTCNKCGKNFTREGHLKDHLNRKKPCIKPIITNENENINNINIIKNISNSLLENNQDKSIVDNICPYCNKVFFQKFNVKKHINLSCKQKKDHDQKKQQELEMMVKIKEILLNNTPTNISNNITNITNNNITNNIQVNIYSAGKEDLSRLSQEDILKICTSGTYYPIVAAEVIHCNKNYPEFQNFLISNLRSSTGLVFQNDTWISKTQEEILTNIMQIDKKHVSTLIKDLSVDTNLQLKLESTKDEINSTESKGHQKPKIKTKLYNASKMILKNKKNLNKTIADEE
jgi:hypothetical protein